MLAPCGEEDSTRKTFETSAVESTTCSLDRELGGVIPHLRTAICYSDYYIYEIYSTRVRPEQGNIVVIASVARLVD